MAIRQVTTAGIKKDSAAGSYKKSDAFTGDFRILNLNKPGQSFKVRILPPNNDETVFTDPYEGFAVAFPSHFGVGDNGKEPCVCPSRVAPRYMVKCPMCAEFAEGKSTKRSKLTFYYYMNLVLLSKHEGIERQDAEGKLIVYTVRVPKAQVYDILAGYCENADRAIADPFSLTKGCAVTISVTEKKVGQDKYPQYNVQFNEASVGDLTPKVRESDIKDLRLITRYIPTTAAMRNIAEGVPVAEAMAVFGKIDIVSGKQIGGTKEEPKAVEAAKDKAVVDDLDGDLELDATDVEQTKDLDDELGADAGSDDLELSDDEMPL